jgi:hypothetical protein
MRGEDGEKEMGGGMEGRRRRGIARRRGTERKGNGEEKGN